MSVFNLHFLGRAGNNLFSYCFARGYCEQHGIELRTDPWWGERVFQGVQHQRIDCELPRRDENTLRIGERNISFRSYCQRQYCADYYSQEKLRQWLGFKHWVKNWLDFMIPDHRAVVMHVRRGDYAGAGYPLVSLASYDRAMSKTGHTGDSKMVVSDESPTLHPQFTGELEHVPDLFIMAHCKNAIFRANSSFSFWGAALAEANFGTAVYAPEIVGFEGGKEQDVGFGRGNFWRIADFDFVEPIFIRP